MSLPARCVRRSSDDFSDLHAVAGVATRSGDDFSVLDHPTRLECCVCTAGQCAALTRRASSRSAAAATRRANPRGRLECCVCTAGQCAASAEYFGDWPGTSTTRAGVRPGGPQRKRDFSSGGFSSGDDGGPLAQSTAAGRLCFADALFPACCQLYSPARRCLQQRRPQ